MSRILIVEDDETLRGELSYFLIGNGYEVSVITDFKDTLDEMLKTDTELILLDLNLPGIDGQFFLFQTWNCVYKYLMRKGTKNVYLHTYSNTIN